MENMHENEDKRPEEQGDSECCPPGSSVDCCSDSGKPPRRSRGKMLLFLLIVSAAVAVGGYSIWQKSNAETGALSGASCCPGGASGTALNVPKSIARLTAGKEAVFILLASENDKQDKAAIRKVEQVVDELETKGKQVAAFPLGRNWEAYDELVERYSVTSFPCVMVMGQNPKVPKISGRITEKKLLNAYAQASRTKKSCGSRCEPSKCGK